MEAVEATNKPIPSTHNLITLNQKPIREIKYNSDGDFIFGCSQDAITTMTNRNGQVIGTFERDGGAVNTLLPLECTLITASSDTKLVSWDILTGKMLSELETDSIVRAIDGSESALYIASDNSMGIQGYIGRVDLRTNKIERLFMPTVSSTKGFIKDDCFICGNEIGEVHKYGTMSQETSTTKPHHLKITSLNPSACKSFFVTSSLDSTIKIVDSGSLETKKKFKAEEPVNSAAIFPTNDIVISGGGINARDVTTTKGKSTFDTCFYDIVTTHRVGFYNAHIGPINSVAVAPDGKQVATGGEDGRIALVQMGDDFRSGGFTSLFQSE
ncbi:EIF3I [Enterospora canceri]|uniref:Serine-threonine kinase receptor-associated protein n=1 Tax=Enterospora canceri TaxID=1081671 RepID=A0A1Y1S7R2_9MICR|nr:EIF3I [Enterospora canceri]